MQLPLVSVKIAPLTTVVYQMQKLIAPVLLLVCWPWMIASLRADAITFSNATAITIPDFGVASIYPATIDVSGISGQVTGFTLTLNGVSHAFSDDMSAAIVSPGGTAVLLFSGAGPAFGQLGTKQISNVTWTFDDNAAATLPQRATPSSGTYKPGLFEWDDTFPDPGPALGAYGFTFAPYLSEDLNGQWRLFVMDSNPGDGGSIAGGWSMNITFDPTAVPEPSTVALFTLIAGAVGARRWRRIRCRKP